MFIEVECIINDLVLNSIILEDNVYIIWVMNILVFFDFL